MLEIAPTDLQRYRALVGAIDMPDAAKDEVILVVRSMMQDFVDRAFGDHPAQISGGETRRKVSLESSLRAKLAFNFTSETSPPIGGHLASPNGLSDETNGENGTPESSHLLPS